MIQCKKVKETNENIQSDILGKMNLETKLSCIEIKNVLPRI